MESVKICGSIIRENSCNSWTVLCGFIFLSYFSYNFLTLSQFKEIDFNFF